MSITVSGAFTPGILVIEHEELVATETINYYYGPDGERVKKTSDAGTSLYIGSGYEKRSDDTYVKSIFMGNFRIAEMRSDGTIWFQHTDHLNSTNVVTNINGERAHLYEYSPYGGTTRDDAAVIQSGSEESRSLTPYKYTGQEEDTETGLYYYHARYYDPELGRFIQADSIVQSPYDPQTLNRYAYCRNNPVKFVDPSGHGWFSHIRKVVCSIAGAVIGYHFGGAAGARIGAAIGGALGGGFDNLYSGKSFTKGLKECFSYGYRMGSAITAGDYGKCIDMIIHPQDYDQWLTKSEMGNLIGDVFPLAVQEMLHSTMDGQSKTSGDHSVSSANYDTTVNMTEIPQTTWTISQQQVNVFNSQLKSVVVEIEVWGVLWGWE